jgi:cytochrome c553
MKRLLLTCVAIGFSSLLHAADIDAGKASSAMCVGCHGTNGISMIPTYPNLAGQKAAYLESALKAYKSKERAGGNAAIMWGLAAPLSDADIANLAAYYQSLSAGGS